MFHGQRRVPSEPPEHDLVARIRDRDEEALASLIRMHGPRVRWALLRRFGRLLDQDEIVDAVHMAMVVLWEGPDRYDSTKGALDAWLIGVATNVGRRIVTRECGYYAQHDTLDHEELVPAPGDDAPAAVSELVVALLEEIDRLSPLQRDVIRGDLASGGTADDGRLAARLGSTADSVKAARWKAKKRIREALLKRGFFAEEGSDV